MKKFYSLVLMAAALLIGTNAWAVTRTASDAESFEAAWKAAQNNDVIQLTNDVQIDHILWLGGGKSLTLDLNGQVLSNTARLKYMFVIEQGDLNVITSLPNGRILQNNAKNEELFHITGSEGTDVNPKTAASGYYSHLTIGDGVFVDAQVKNAIVVCERVTYKNLNAYSATASQKDLAALGWATAGTTIPSEIPSKGSAYANEVRVDIHGNIHGEKYAFKVNGNVVKPASVDNSAFIHLHSTSDLNVPATNDAEKKPVAAYSSGYARWLIEGHCIGSTAVYVKSGDVEINDAVIESNYTGNYVAASATKSGVTASGSAIVIESNKAYQGEISVEIGGDTKVSATNGYAIDEAVTNAPTTEVDVISITGGSFEGGNVGTTEAPQQGTIKISETTVASAQDPAKETSIVVGGGQVSGHADLGEGTTLEDLIAASGSYTTVVEDPVTHEQTVVISEGTKPAAAPNNFEIDDFAGAGADVNLSDDELVEKNQVFGDKAGAPVKLQIGTLLMNNATSPVSLTIKSGHIIEAEKVIMGYKAQIIVEAGAQFIVKGEQGITAPVASNIVLHASELEQAIFLFNPAVTSNRHPNATVEFVSRSFRKSATNYRYQRFGIPTHTKLTEVTAKNPDTEEAVPTGFTYYDYNTGWEIAGYIHQAGQTMDYEKMAKPFDYYQMLNNASEMGTIVSMKGELFGNANPTISILGSSWFGLSNSYMAPLSAEKLIELIPSTVQKAFYLYDVEEEQASWNPVTLAFLEDIRPMQPFLIKNSASAADVTINYETAVYNPAMGIVPNPQAGAPRRAASNITKAKLIVKGENCIDRVGVVEGDDFSAEFDNGYDAVKYMNDGINMYVSADEKMAIFATDNLENTYVGFQSVNGGNYTIEFANVQGAELTLVDHETGARVAMVEGATYEFTAAANSVNDYRFEIVESAKLPTAIENTEAVKSAKGIYTITGQFVGEMNVWNTLPAGIYVVNGEKRVK